MTKANWKGLDIFLKSDADSVTTSAESNPRKYSLLDDPDVKRWIKSPKRFLDAYKRIEAILESKR